MSDAKEILLDAGTAFVTVSAAPGLIAAALYPPPTAEPTISYLRKLGDGAFGERPRSSLTLYDIVLDTQLSFGTLALTSLWINGAPPKGTRLHRQFGAVHFWPSLGWLTRSFLRKCFLQWEGAWEG